MISQTEISEFVEAQTGSYRLMVDKFFNNYVDGALDNFSLNEKLIILAAYSKLHDKPNLDKKFIETLLTDLERTHHFETNISEKAYYKVLNEQILEYLNGGGPIDLSSNFIFDGNNPLLKRLLTSTFGEHEEYYVSLSGGSHPTPFVSVKRDLFDSLTKNMPFLFGVTLLKIS